MTPESNSNAQRVIRWGVIGPGRAAARFAQGIQAVSNATLAAVWGRNPGKTRDYAARFGITAVCNSLGRLLEAPE